MGYITNQWLKGIRQRRRAHGPVDVAIGGTLATDEWDQEHKIVVEISATRPTGDYQHLLVTQEELDQLVANVAEACTLETRLQLASSALSQLNDSQLLSFLSKLLRTKTLGENGDA